MKALFIVPQIGFNEFELFTIRKYLEKNGIGCTIASFSKGKVIGKKGKSAIAKETLCSVNVKIYDFFIVVGGMNVSSLVEHRCVKEIINSAYSSGKKVALLCMAPALFADILKGKKVTVFKSKNMWSVKEVKEKGLIYVDEPVVVDGNLLTCRDESDSLLLAKEIVQKSN